MQRSPAEDQWSVLIGERQYGPFGIDYLKELAAQGRLLEGDWVWNPGLAAWVAAEDVSGLFAKSAQIQIDRHSSIVTMARKTKAGRPNAISKEEPKIKSKISG